MQPLRIIIAEDEAVIALLLGEVLAGMGHSICATVSTADEAIAAAARYRPGLLIIDASLAVGDGLTAVETILENRFVPHIFTTGNALRVRQLKPDAIVLEKPFHEAELAEAIASALSQAQELQR